MESQTRRVNWRDLPSDLLNSIAKRLTNAFDVQRFRAVCPEWRSSTPAPINNKSLLTQITLPLRDYYSNQSKNVDVYITSFYKFTPLTAQGNANSSIIEVVYTNPDRKLRLIDPIEYDDFASSFVTCSDLTVNLLDYDIDVLGNCCRVSCSKFTKIVVCGGDNVSMLGIDRGKCLVYWRLVKDKWTFDVKERDAFVLDVINYKEGFCAVEETGRAVFVDQDFELKQIASPFWDETEVLMLSGYQSLHLIQSLSDLLLVAHHCYGHFEIYRLDEEVGNWVKLENLDGRILFLDDDCSFSVSPADFDGCNGNKIFHEDFYGPTVDIWYVHDLDKKSLWDIEPNYSKMFKPPESWLVLEDPLLSFSD